MVGMPRIERSGPPPDLIKIDHDCAVARHDTSPA